ncbi:MAG: orotidine-5'-phosphate decarboxylase, partial [Bdellovibrio sp.]
MSQASNNDSPKTPKSGRLLLRSPLIVALDVDDLKQALKLAEELHDVAGCFKVGPRLVFRYGEAIIQQLARLAPVFVDCKFFDIPSTMVASVRAAFAAGASFVTIHALAGADALDLIARLEEELRQTRPFQILNVTILTSWEDHRLPPNWIQQPIERHVQSLVGQVVAAGMDGIVCSPLELRFLANRDLFLVTPGVRLDRPKDTRGVCGDDARGGSAAHAEGTDLGSA